MLESTVSVIDPELLLPSFAVAVIVTLPSAFAVTSPFASTVATFVLLDVQESDLSFASSGRTTALI